MKKIFIILSLLLTSFVLISCKEKIIDIPDIKEDDDPVEVPVKEDEPVKQTPTETDEKEKSDSDEDEEEPEVITEYVEVIKEVPAEVQMKRKYKPGTYFNANMEVNGNGGYTYVVVVVDRYGDIAGVHIDETYSHIVLYEDELNNVYTFVEGDGETIPSTYRLIDKDLEYEKYPTYKDAITTDDLIVGLHTDEIDKLEPIQVNETKMVVNEQLPMKNVTYKNQINLIADKIVKDNTTYGFNLYDSGDKVKTDSIAGVSIDVDEYLVLIQEILDGKAKITENVILADKSNPKFGSYKPGTYYNHSDRILTDGNLNYSTSLVVVDDYGVIAGVYLDETSADTLQPESYSTKWIMNEAYGMATVAKTNEWYIQAEQLAKQVTYNQGVEGIDFYGYNALNQKLEATIGDKKEGSLRPLYTDQISGVSIRVDGMTQALKETLDEIRYTDYQDGVYSVSNIDNNDLYSVLVIKDGDIQSLFVDKVKSVFQAQYLKNGVEYGLFKFIRLFEVDDKTFTTAIKVYKNGDKFYSLNDVEFINDIQLDSRDQLEKDELVELTNIELDTIVPIPGNYTAKIAMDSEYVNLVGWSNNSQFIVDKIVESNGTHNLFLNEHGYINTNSDISFKATSILDIVHKVLYKARDEENKLFSESGKTISKKLADGDYVVKTLPENNGNIDFGFMSVKDGNIVGLYFDTTYINNEMPDTMFKPNSKDEWTKENVNITDLILRNQGTLVNSIIDSYDYVNSDTINSINDLPLFSIKTDIKVDKFIDIFEQLVINAANEKLVVDSNEIYTDFLDDENFFKEFYVRVDEELTNFLPKTITSDGYTNEYELNWYSLDDRTLEVDETDNGFTIITDDDIEEDKIVEVVLEVSLPNSKNIISSYVYEVPILTPYTEGANVLSSEQFIMPASYLLENTNFDFPTSDKVNVSWISSDEAVLDSTGNTYEISEDKEIELKAFVDLNGNGFVSSGEPVREYKLKVLTLDSAIERVQDSIMLSNIYKYIDDDFTLSTKSPVWGVEYTWDAYSSYIKLNEEDEHVHVNVIRKDTDTNVTFTADLNIGDSNDDVTKSIKILSGNEYVYKEYAKEDLENIDFNNLDLSKLVVGDDLGFDENAIGSLRDSDITFEVDDFGMFVSPEGIIEHVDPTKDATFNLTVKVENSGGLDKETYEKVFEITILSKTTQALLAIEDKKMLEGYTIDLSHNAYKDVTIQLPMEGYMYGSSIAWSVDTTNSTVNSSMYDDTNLLDGQIKILTESGTETISGGEFITLNATVTYGNQTPEDKVIKIKLKD